MEIEILAIVYNFWSRASDTCILYVKAIAFFEIHDYVRFTELPELVDSDAVICRKVETRQLANRVSSMPENNECFLYWA